MRTPSLLMTAGFLALIGGLKAESNETLTERSTGCPCWYNITQVDQCACCDNNETQCGYPVNTKCQIDKNPLRRKGCKGIYRRKGTLSSTGYPCPWDSNDRSCPWCSPGYFMCMPGSWANSHPNGDNFCVKPYQWKVCLSIPQDCRMWPNQCDPNAACVFSGVTVFQTKFDWQVYRCACNKGYTGNGIQCASDVNGSIAARADSPVKVTMKLTTDFFEGAGSKSDFPHGAFGNDLMKSMDNMLKNGKDVCGDGCKANVVHCDGSS